MTIGSVLSFGGMARRAAPVRTTAVPGSMRDPEASPTFDEARLAKRAVQEPAAIESPGTAHVADDPERRGPRRPMVARRGVTRTGVVIIKVLALFALISAVECSEAADLGDYGELSGFVAADLRLFPETPQFDVQRDDVAYPALVFQPEYRYEWNEGLDRLTVVPFFRLAFIDKERQHFDLREFNWLHVGEGWDVLVGLGVVFWGVAESRHLINIINQTDLLEDIDEEDRLGQPMINFNHFGDLGTFNLFVLPGFRERKFPDAEGRLRPPIPVNNNDPVYESGAGNKHVDFAGRWSNVFGDWDIGLAHFWGTSREPRFVPRFDRFGRPVELIPYYDIIHQTSVDVQATKGSWLWKFEGITRSGHDRRFYAVVTGFEYTVYQVAGTDADLGLVAEYLWDGRSDQAPPTPFEHDIFIGARIAPNDVASTELLFGTYVDYKSGAVIAIAEAGRRLGDSWTLNLDARFFFNIPEDNFALVGLKNDSFINLRLSYFF